MTRCTIKKIDKILQRAERLVKVENTNGVIKGWLIGERPIDSDPHKDKYITLYAEYEKCAAEHGIELWLTNDTELCMPIDELARLIEDKRAKECAPEFVIFQTKNHYLSDQLEMLGIPCFNPSRGIANCYDKAEQSRLLVNAGIRHPRTMISPCTFQPNTYSELPEFYDIVDTYFTYPVVMKETHGSFGSKVYLVHNRSELEDIANDICPEDFIVQEYISAAFGKSVRVIVMDGKAYDVGVLCVNDSDFRSNLTNGGDGRVYELNDEEKQLAVEATEALGLYIGGVDLFFDAEGAPIVCEVNSNPQWKSFYRITGINIADDQFEMIREKLGYPHWSTADLS